MEGGREGGRVYKVVKRGGGLRGRNNEITKTNTKKEGEKKT